MKVIRDTKEIQRIIRDYNEQLYAHKMDNLEENGRFLEMYDLPWLNQEETENMNRPITSNESGTVIKTIRKQKSKPESFTGECYQTFREELTPILLKLY